MPVMNPLDVKPDYDPEVDDELLASAGNLTPENLLVLVTVSVPSDLKKMSVNLQGPFVINVEEHKACQVIVEVTILEVKGDQVKIGITAPKDVPIYRKEVYMQIQEANKEAVNADGVEALRSLLG